MDPYIKVPPDYRKKTTSLKKEKYELLEITFDTTYVIAQVIGLIAMGCGIISFQSKKRISILVLQTTSNFLWVLQYLLIGAYSAVVANALGIIRNVIYLFRGKSKFADSKIVPLVFIGLFVISGIITYETPFDILPVIAMVFSTVAFFVTNENKIRWLSIAVTLSWLTFGISAGSISSMISDGTNFISIVVALIRYRGVYEYERGKDRTNDNM